MLYFDTAYLARCYLKDGGFETVRRLAGDHAVASSELARVELASVFHRKLRERALTPKAHRAICAQFDQDDVDGIWTWLTLDSAIVEASRELFSELSRKVFLRSADAIHLVTAKQSGFAEIYSNDKHLLTAAPHLGLKAIDIM